MNLVPESHAPPFLPTDSNPQNINRQNREKQREQGVGQNILTEEAEIALNQGRQT